MYFRKQELPKFFYQLMPRNGGYGAIETTLVSASLHTSETCPIYILFTTNRLEGIAGKERTVFLLHIGHRISQVMNPLFINTI